MGQLVGRKRLMQILLVLILLPFLGCRSDKSTSLSSALRVGLHHSIDHLNVFTQNTTDFWKVQTFLFEPLLRTDPVTGELKPNLAQSWSWSKDKSKITFELRKSLKWSDGEPLTVDDILFTLNAHENPKFKSLYMGIYPPLLKSYKKLSDQKVEFYFVNSQLSHLRAIGLNLFVYPKHIYLKGRRNRIPVTSGPFMVNEFQPGVVLKLKQNPYWHGRSLKELKALYSYRELEFYSSTGERELADFLSEGKIDYFQCLDPRSFKELSEKLKSNPHIQVVKATDYRLLGLRVVSVNHRKIGLSELKVRQALMYGFNRQFVNEKLFFGLLKPANGLWSENHPLAVASEEKVQYPYNFKKANQLLDSAGWKINNRNGIREKYIRGKLHRLEFQFLDFNKENEPLLTLFKESAKKIGVKINVQMVGFSEAMRLIRDLNFDLSLNQAQWVPMLPNLRYWYFSDNKGNPYLNVGGFKDAELDQWILKIEESFDRKERKKFYESAYTRIQKTLPDLFWFHDRYIFYFINKRVKRPVDVLPFSIGVPLWKITAPPQ